MYGSKGKHKISQLQKMFKRGGEIASEEFLVKIIQRIPKV